MLLHTTPNRSYLTNGMTPSHRHDWWNKAKILLGIISSFCHENVQYESLYFWNWVLACSHNVHMTLPTIRSCRLFHTMLNNVHQMIPHAPITLITHPKKPQKSKSGNFVDSGITWCQNKGRVNDQASQARMPEPDLILLTLCGLHSTH